MGLFSREIVLYGVSDIDLVLVISPETLRGSPDYYDILDSYKRIRRFFPYPSASLRIRPKFDLPVGDLFPGGTARIGQNSLETGALVPTPRKQYL